MNARRRATGLVGALCAATLLSGALAAGPSPVADAAMRRDIEAVRTLLKGGADVNAAQGDGMTALHWAAEHGAAPLAEMLLAAGGSVRSVTRIGDYTPLHIASRNGSAAVVKALLAAGSDAQARTIGGSTPLHFAAQAGSAEAIAALVDRGADPNARESEWGQTPLMFAAAYDRAAAIAALIQRGADPNVLTRAVNLTEQAALDQAASRRRGEVLAAYRGPPAGGRQGGEGAGRGGSDGRQGGGGGGGGGGREGTPPEASGPPPSPRQIQAAIIAGRVVYSASKEVDTTRVEEQADTADGQVEGYAGSVGGMGGLTALHHAVRQGNIAATLALLDGGAKVDQPSEGDNTTPLLMASINGQFDVAMRLIERGADPRLASDAGATPLYAVINAQWAPKSRYPQPQAVQTQKTPYLDVVKALLDAGADPNARLRRHLWYFAYNNCGNGNCGLEQLDGTTPFWRAVYSVDVDAMKLLVARGADHTLGSIRPPGGGRGGRGGRGGGGGGRGGAFGGGQLADDPDEQQGVAQGGVAAQSGAAAARIADAGRTASAVQGARVGRGGGRGGAGAPGDAVRAPAARDSAGAPTVRDSAAAPTPLDSAAARQAAMDSAARAVPAGSGVFAIHAAAGVGYGNGFAANSHRHAPGGWIPALRYLIEELGHDVNARDLNGYTPLHHAAARGDNEMILYLVSKGADPKAVARNGRTTVDMANGPVQRLRPFPETIALLEKLGAINNHRCVSC